MYDNMYALYIMVGWLAGWLNGCTTLVDGWRNTEACMHTLLLM
jgi:hypothetical protein